MKKKEWTGERLETFVFNESTIEHLHRYAIAAEFVTGKKVLDIACGEGYGSNLLANTAYEVVGIDVDTQTTRNAGEKYKRENLSFREGAIEKIPFAQESFDVVVSFETIEHINDHEAALKELKRVLKPGGLLLVSTPEKKNYSEIPQNANPFHKKELNEKEFSDLLTKYFKFISITYQDVLTTSVIMPQVSSQLKFYAGNFEQVATVNNIEPLYLLAICSDTELITLPPSLFLGKSILDRAFTEKEEEVRNTVTYKIGHFILFPVKFIRYILKKTPIK